MYTENNSKEMKTVVETFVIEETAELIYNNEKLDQWNARVTELGLKGQTKIVAPEKSPIPFMHMKQGLKNVFEVLCPRKVDVTEYDVTPIPVEILDLIALSKRENHFDKIQIWYDDKSPDPACIGIKGDYYCYDQRYHTIPELKSVSLEEAQNQKKNNPGVYSYGANTENHYLLGKWADVKHSFAELTEMAKKRYMEFTGAELRKEIKTAQRALDDLEMTAIEKFN